MFEKVLIAIDGSPHAARALEAGRDLISLSGGEAKVVHVREATVYTRTGALPDENRDEAQKILDDALAALKAGAVTATGNLRTALTGHVATEILDEANEWGASVIVLASRGLTDLAGLVIGSTTHKVLHLGHIPVLVVR
jgi:nucleotide-binding universal stress UspA family protein